MQLHIILSIIMVEFSVLQIYEKSINIIFVLCRLSNNNKEYKETCHKEHIAH